MADGKMMDMYDCRRLALMIARTYPCGYLELGTIGASWVPCDQRRRRWTARRCSAVIDQMVAFGCCSLHHGITGTLVRVTERGYRMLDINGAPAIRDIDAERLLGPQETRTERC